MTAKTITINISENQEQLLKEINAEGIHHSSKNPILNDVIDNLCAELNSDNDIQSDEDADLIDEKNVDQLKTFVSSIKVEGSLGVMVDAKDEKEALQKIKDGKYETDDDCFSLQDCDLLTDKITEDDLEEM